MGRRAEDITGHVFGQLTVLSRNDAGGKNVRWNCGCACGEETVVMGQNLRNGSVRSCGCGAHPTTHGMANTRLYQTWASMHARCRSPSFHARDRYAARGIVVCPDWDRFEPFRDWAIANGYADGLTIDRIDNDRGYCPSNCRFITVADQQRNKGNHRLLSFRGETFALYEWSARLGISAQTLHNRLTRGWTVERTLSTPLPRRKSA